MSDPAIIETDVLVIGGGTAGCVAAIKAKEALPNGQVLLLEKANVKRSGAIALGMDDVSNGRDRASQPRAKAVLTHSAFVELKRQCLEQLRSEVAHQRRVAAAEEVPDLVLGSVPEKASVS